MNKKLFFILTTIVLLIAAACSGYFVDPGAGGGVGGGLGDIFGDDDKGGSGGGGGSYNPGGSNNSGGGTVKYDVSWNGGMPEFGYPASLEVYFNGTSDQCEKIAAAIKLTDIEMSPTGVITLDAVSDQSTRDFFRVKCTALKSGTVKITLKSIAGFKFVKADWGTDTITVTK